MAKKNQIRETDFNSANLFIKTVKANGLGDLAMNVPFYIKKVVTAKWKNAGSPMDTVGLKRFCVEILRKETGLMQDTGCVVVLKSPRTSRRKVKPTTVHRLDGKMGAPLKDLERRMVFYDSENREIFDMPFCTRKVAAGRCRDMVKSGELRSCEIYCYVEYRIKDRKPIFKMDIHSDKDDIEKEKGEYIVFGITAVDYNG